MATASTLVLLTLSPASLLVLPASSFEQQLSYRTASGIMFLDRLTAYTYQGGPLSGFDLQTRSQVLSNIVRGCDEDGLLLRGGEPEVVDPSGEFNWQRTGTGTRVACRGAQLVWNVGSDRWEVVFTDLLVPTKPYSPSADFDELLLAIYSPLGVHVFWHDLQTGVRTKGRDAIQLVAPRGETRWREALLAVQSKMSCGGCRRLLELPYDDPRVAGAIAETPRPLTSAAFADQPLAECTSVQRAKLLTSLCRRIDGRWLHPDARIEDPPSVLAGGGRQPKLFEWQRDEVRVACKSAQLLWDLTCRYWKVQFTNVKLPLEGLRDTAFDELLLAVYTPEGVHIFQHNWQAGVSTNGKTTATGGHRIRFYGRKGQTDWRPSLETILSKMEAAGCTRLALVEFDRGEGKT